jgi:tetratricopeptide (TPR) repeat protein
MSGYDDLARGLGAADELGCDDPRTLDALRAAIESGDLEDEDLATAYLALGGCLHATGYQEPARQCLEGGIQYSRMPDKLALLHHELGETLLVLGQEREAEAACRRSLELDRQHAYAPDSMALVGRALYLRSNGNPALLEESYSFFYEAYAVLTSARGDDYTVFHSRAKALFDALYGMGVCKEEMGHDKERFEAVKLYEQAVQMASTHRDDITEVESTNVYGSLIRLLRRMGLEREAELAEERAKRSLN